MRFGKSRHPLILESIENYTSCIFVFSIGSFRVGVTIWLAKTMGSYSRVWNPLFHPFLFLYQVIQWLMDKILSPNPPAPGAHLRRPKIAVIGAGITGVTSAAHCIGHGFDVVIFEAGSPENLGGIWSVSRRQFVLSYGCPRCRTFANSLGRESTTPPACKSTRSCTDSTRQ